jgi:hypothetical protein
MVRSGPVPVPAFHAGRDPNRIGVRGANSGGYLAALLGIASDEGNSKSEDPIERAGSRVQAVGPYHPAGYDLVSDVKRAPEILQALPAMQIGEEKLDAIGCGTRIRVLRGVSC